MCGRLNVVSDPLCQLVTEHLGFKFDAPTNRDLRPTQAIEAIALDEQQSLQQITTSWGIQPAWAKRLLINAQAETVAEKPTFKHAFKHHRCVVPCSGWYEWKQHQGQPRKTKYLFAPEQHQPAYMAAIFYPHDELGAQLVTLTTAPTEFCADYHHRMPLLIRPNEVEFWLRSEPEALAPLLITPDDINLSAICE